MAVVVSKHSYVRRVTAYHEAGHAVLAARCGVHLVKASIIPNGRVGGYVRFVQIRDCPPNLAITSEEWRKIQCERDCIISLAGEIAQKRYAPRSLRRMFPYRDVFDTIRAARDAHGNIELINPYVKYLTHLTRTLVDDCWEEIERVATALLEKDELSGLEIWKLILNGPPPERVQRIGRALALRKRRWPAMIASGPCFSPDKQF
ncbi:hypothetical protein FZC33_15965 [Labrys sp. KNU-23]|uniref:hypothetical protein n=1 Tax=Labrys sp. KNU-23 TaxID=2789216 RepID=UPI0011EF0655|nr:hypothetical protein [Labrys sp. KNU-23]QEN87722.1 hypothetical protein FZC33_15965 [Labrys sp. KNU-23]